MIAFVRNTVGGYGSPAIFDLSGIPASGNLLVVAIGTNSGSTNSITSITDNASNSYTRATSAFATGYSSTEIWYASNVSPGIGAHTLTITGASSSVIEVSVDEWSGVATSSPLDQVLSDATDNGTTFDVGPTGSTAVNDELIVVACSQNSAATLSVGSGYSNFTQATGVNTVAMESKIVSSAGTQTGAMTTSISGKGTALIATFKGAGSVITPPPPTIDASRNLIGAPKGKFIAEYGGSLYIMNCELSGVVYPDRAYKSSPPTGAVTFIQGDQSGALTSIKVDSVRYLKAGMAIDVYTAGTETKIYDITITSVDKAANKIIVPSASYTLKDNDEIWLDGRKSDLAYLWNTDYPTPQAADWLKIPPGFDFNSEITAWAKSNNRLFLFTENSTHKWDGANLVTVYEDIGCISHESVQSIGDWLIWLDAEGKVRARNDATGQHELISKPIQNILATVPAVNLPDAAAGRFNNVYKLYLGSVGDTYLRICYDFDSNTWSHETHTRATTVYSRSNMDGPKNLYFLSNTGRMFIDETGYTDAGDNIPFVVKFGRRNQDSEQLKNYHGAYIYSKNIAGAVIKTSLDNSGDFKEAGQLKQGVEKIPFSTINGQASARDINTEISINVNSETPEIDGIVYYYNQEEDKFGQPTKR